MRVLPSVPDEWLTLGARDQQWAEQWGRVCEAVPGASDAWNARAVAGAFVESLGAGDVALIGSSNSIRQVDDVAPIWEPEGVPVLVANRGLAGIDGTTSTAVGMALAVGRPVSALMGDSYNFV